MKATTAAPSLRPTTPLASALERASHCARIAEDNKARDVVVLDMRGVTPLYDYFVIATGASRRQLHAIAEEIDGYMHGEGDERMSQAGYEACKWIVEDYGDVVVHIFDSVSREYYDLERLWADAKPVDWRKY